MIIGILLAAAAVFFLFFSEELYRYIFCRSSSGLFMKLFDSKGHAPEYYDYRAAGEAKMRSLPQTEYTISSQRGEKLKGFYYPCGAEGKKIAFIIHGYRSEHADTAGICYDYYSSRGIDVFACDHTAEGESEGHIIGFDVLESRDCLLWIDFLKKTFGNDTQIILHGFSMGAATVMQMSSHCPPNVKFIVEDSGYENARASMDHQIGPMYGPMRLANKVFGGYDWNDSDVTRSLSASRIPILFVHGQDDKLVPYCNGPKLYDSYQGQKDCLFPARTKHIESFYTVPEEYAQKLDSFAEKYLN